MEIVFTEILIDTTQIAEVEQALMENGVQLIVDGEPRTANNITELCNALNDSTTLELSSNLLTIQNFLNNNTSLIPVLVQNIIRCLAESFDVPIPG